MPIANSEFDVKIDNVIVAIGQPAVDISELQTYKDGTIEVNENTLRHL